MSEPDIDDILNRLIQLDYFKYTLNENLNRAYDNVKRNYKDYKTLDSIDKYPSKYPEDFRDTTRRYYHADAEDLAEMGVREFVEELLPVLELQNISIKSLEDNFYTTEDVPYEIIINNQRYEIWNSVVEDCWTEAHKNTIAVINSLLREANSEEMLFALGSGNDTGAILLTERLFGYLTSIPLHPVWQPYRFE